MKQQTIAQAGILALALVFGMTLFACGGKSAQAQTSGGAAVTAQATDTAKSAVKGGAGGGKPAEATDFVYALNKAKNGVIISGIQKDAKFGAHLVVPAEIEGFPVVGYLVWDDVSDDSAKKRNQPPLESVVFPDSITFMGGSGDYVLDKRYGFGADHENYGDKYLGKFCDFSYCKSLKSIVLPKNLKIAPGRLRDLPSLKPKGITWPQAMEVIQGFGNNTTTEVVIPNGVKVIADGAFSSMQKLTTVTIPDSVEQIGAAFGGCPELTTVNLPTHPIKYYGDPPAAFVACPKLGIAAQKAIKDSGYSGSFR